MRSNKNIFEYSRGYKDGRAEQQAKTAALVEAVGNWLHNDDTFHPSDTEWRARDKRLLLAVRKAHEALTTEAPGDDREGES